MLATELVKRGVNVIATPGNTNASLAAKAATSTIPIVFGVADDPVKFGLVESLARPGGNATGINYLTAELVSKRFGLLRELVPGATRIAVLVNPADVLTAESTRRDAQSAAGTFGLQIEVFEARTSDEIDRRSMQSSRRGTKPCSSVRGRSLTRVACTLRRSLRVMRSPQHIQYATTPKQVV